MREEKVIDKGGWFLYFGPSLLHWMRWSGATDGNHKKKKVDAVEKTS
jgi:hypothetical protein